MSHGGGDLIIGDQPLDQYLRPLAIRVDDPTERMQLIALLDKYDAGINLTADETGFVFDKAKQIALSFFS